MVKDPGSEMGRFLDGLGCQEVAVKSSVVLDFAPKRQLIPTGRRLD